MTTRKLWHVEGNWYVIDDQGYRVASCNVPADATLAATAPEMLTLLNFISDALQNSEEPLGMDTVTILRSLIDRAEGRK